jgi:hypothetical protein
MGKIKEEVFRILEKYGLIFDKKITLPKVRQTISYSEYFFKNSYIRIILLLNEDLYHIRIIDPIDKPFNNLCDFEMCIKELTIVSNRKIKLNEKSLYSKPLYNRR